MSEIKFACPHCGQHITCDRDYADISILCPECEKPMEVPRLSAAEASHPDLCVVASTPKPKERFVSHIPTVGLWTANEWEERYRAAATPPQQTPAWLLCAIITVIAAALLKASLSANWAVVLCVIVGAVLACFFVAKGQPAPQASAAHASLGSALSIAGRIIQLLLAIPVVALGVLFVGCTVCR
ncbi:MAG: hypothetical protein NT154_25965 [Verrucomicrobia bacterium]|nr:hypothetical protein [Verrucomicrobiota bacterium]